MCYNTFNIYIIIVLPPKKIYINEPENELREYMSTYIQHSSFHRHSFFDRSCAYYPIPLHFVELIRFLPPPASTPPPPQGKLTLFSPSLKNLFKTFPSLAPSRQNLVFLGFHFFLSPYSFLFSASKIPARTDIDSRPFRFVDGIGPPDLRPVNMIKPPARQWIPECK